MPYIYTALGDSLTVGVGSHFRTGFVKSYANMIKKTINQPINLNIEAKSGMTSVQLWERLYIDEIRKQIANADLITITIGGNDLIQTLKFNDLRLLDQSIYLFALNLKNILSDITNIKTSMSRKPYFIQLIGLYNPIPQLPLSHYFLHKYNNVLKTFSSRYVSYVDIYSSFSHQEKALLTFDGHPNNQGYRIMTEKIYKDFIKKNVHFK